MQNNLPNLNKRLEMRNKPEGKEPVMFQKWRNILFLNWEFDPVIIQKRLPRGLFVDTFENKAYIGVTPLFMRDVRLKYTPAIPGVSDFLELNFRTYVYDENGEPGIFFFSLDANQKLVVEAARNFAFLNYTHAEMNAEIKGDGEIIFTSLRAGVDEKLLSMFRYKSIENQYTADAETLDFFLIERYKLFSYNSEMHQLYSARVHHIPYLLLKTELLEWDDNIFEVNGFVRPARVPEHITMCGALDVEVYPPEKI